MSIRNTLLKPLQNPLHRNDDIPAGARTREHVVTCNGKTHVYARVSHMSVDDDTHARVRTRERADGVTRDIHAGNPVFDSASGDLGCNSGNQPYRLHVTDHADLAHLFRVPALRDHQRQTIDAAAAGRDVLLIVPTGGGKTAAFWGAGRRRGGLTLVVSPLRSLIADQVRRLTALELPVRFWNMDVADADKAATVEAISNGWGGYLYTTPESLKGRELSRLLTNRVELAVIDEAHCCLRERAFRTPYAWLGRTLTELKVAGRFACTATLPEQDRRALIASLRLHNPLIVTQPIARSNLGLHIVDRHESTLIEILNKHRGAAGIVFCATVRTAQKLYAQFRSQGRNVGMYTGRGMRDKDKAEAQAAFMSGKTPVFICTDAFLLGIDKPDIRFIVHYDPPKSVEDWVQGFGRAGRDDLPATVYGCFRGSKEGQNSRRFLLLTTYPAVEDLAAVWGFLSQAPWRDETAEEIGQQVLGGNGKYSGAACINTLKRFGLATADVNPQDRRRRLYRARGDFQATDWTPYLDEKKQALSRFDQLCDLAGLPDDQIAGRIDEYFNGTNCDGMNDRR